MLTVSKLVAQGRGLSAVLIKRAATVALDWDVRQKSRFETLDSLERRLAVFLPRGQVVRGGDVLLAEDGSLIRVEAAPQEVLVVRAAASASSSFALMRAAYHLGNRHVSLELRPDRLQLEPDPVLADMLRMMGLQVDSALAPFEPEGGAYSGGSGSRVHDHEHAHAHDHEHHEHCGHDHGHGHGHGHGHANKSDGGEAP